MSFVGFAVKHAVVSRILTCGLYLVSEVLLPDHVPHGVDYAPVEVAGYLQGFTRWDAAHFLRISKYGYVADRDYAFFPLLPTLIKYWGTGFAMLFGVSVDESLEIGRASCRERVL